jgi:hypothetical protein
MENYIAIALSLVAVILCIVILSKVNKILDNLHTPIVKKLTPDMNLKPNSRRPVGAQEMAQRGDRNNKDHGKDRQNNNKDARGDKQAQPAQNRDRNEQRSDRGPRRDRREGRPDRPRREFNKPAEAVASAVAPAAEQAPAVEAAAPAAAEARRPLAPRIPVETPAAPAVEAAPAVAAPAAAEVAPVETTFDPSKVRYGRRNVIKKAPELADEA